ncbi:MAG TPA: gamma-glutamyl-gamma-aminobutyrate hydrolase family protein [Bacteroidales bacterium]|nr:gamma-glutamyl-gamma-aminobutyrate hydrolase family protein [Bacteroidales bacterium]
MTDKTAAKELKGLDGILIPGGFGVRGTEGKIETARYARENKIPFLGICLGMQIATIEYARNVAGLPDAGSIELDPKVKDPVIHVMGDADPKKKIGTLKLGSYPVELSPNSHVIEAYGTTQIEERHRHRYAFNLDYLDRLKNSGLKITGISPDGKIIEVVEVEDHPWYVACQYHPEFKSRPNRPHPLFLAYLKAVLKNQK